MSLISVSDKDFNEEVIDHSNNEVVVVDFWAEWCAPCKALIPQLEKILEGEFAGKIRICKIDIDKNHDIPLQYGIMSIPTVIIFKNGKKVSQIIGSNIDKIRSEINIVL